MSNGFFIYPILIITVIFFSAILNRFLNRSRSIFSAAIVSSLLLQILNYIYLGYLDPFTFIAFIVMVLVSIIVSYLFFKVREKISRAR